MGRSINTLGAAAIAASAGMAVADDAANALHAELLADARSHASFAGENSPVKVGGQLQFRYVINSRDNVPSGDEDLALGFQARRTRLEVSGDVHDKQFSYLIQVDFSRSSGAAGLLDGWFKYAIDDNWSLRAGQFKVPLLREELVSGKYQLTADRSETNSVFTQARSQGIQVEYESESWRFAAAFSDGLQSLNTDFTSAGEADYAFTGRLDYRFGAGDWKRYRDFTSWRGEEDGVGGMVGAAAHWQSGGETVGTTDTDVLEATADVSLEGNGWNAFLAGIWRSAEPAGGGDSDDIGVVAQGGFFVSDQTELFARYDVVIPDGDAGSGDEDFNTITVGVNHYILPESHAAKFTADVQWFLDPTADSSNLVGPNTGIGLLSSTDGDQFALRLQFQLLF